MKKKLMIGCASCLLILLSFSVSRISAANTVSDSTNDVWKINYTTSGLYTDPVVGDYHDEIDLVSISLVVEGNNKTLELEFDGIPVIDDYHGYLGTITIGTTFTITLWAGITGQVGEYTSYIMLSNLQTYQIGAAENVAKIYGNTMSFSYEQSYWPTEELDTWTFMIWCMYSADGWMSAFQSAEVYWDYYPDSYGVFTTTSTTGNGDTTTSDGETNGEDPPVPVPGFTLVEPLLVLTVVTAAGAVLKRHRRK